MSTLSSQIANLSPEQLAKLAYELKASKTSKLQEIRRRASGEPCPLSFAQQRLWFIAQLEPDSSAYNCMEGLRMTGELNVPLLEQTLNEVVRRHEALRTTFKLVGDEPTQIVSSEIDLITRVIDLESLPEGEREKQVSKLSSEALRRPFDLARGPLLRVAVLRVNEQEHAILFTTHHIISDGWSLDILVGEIIALYLAFVEGHPSPLAELSFQYADFAIWQRQRLTGPVLDEHLEYWRQHLEGAPHVLALPVDHPRPPVFTQRGSYEALMLSPELSHSVRALGRREGVTLFMTMLAAFDVLLSRYSGQTDFLIGTDIANRNHGTTESLIGFLVNQLVLRVDLAGDPSFKELLERVKEVTLNGYAHQEAPFEKVVEILNPERNLKHAPLFQVKLVLQNAATGNLELPELAISAVTAESPIAKFDLTLVISEGDRISAELEYSTDLFESSTIRRMLTQFERLLESAVREPEQHISELELLSSVERQQLLVERNDTRVPYPESRCIHELFEEQVAHTPEAPALTYQGEHLSYAELNARANQLAHYLREVGVKAETPVGVCLNRSIEMVVALLAILKAGGAYVPFDPEYPTERIAFILEDVSLPIILTHSSFVDEAPSSWAQTLCMDTESELWSALPTTELADIDNISSEQLAYVMYTSGSTGQPKGVAVPHRGVVRLVKQSAYVDFGPSEVFLQLAPVTFDASTLEIWGALLNGGRLVLMPPGAANLPELGTVLRSEGVTVLWLTAGLFHLMVEQELEALACVTQVVAGGDVLSAEHVRRLLRAKGGSGTVVNGYGPTETTTFACCHRMDGETEVEYGVPIGSPIGNTQVYVLGEKMELVGQGMVGELYIGGDGLARGYYNRPGLTAERFTPHPFSTTEGERLYRTGDYVRWRADGTLEFVGRRDTQVKIRGYRVEPGEVEAVLGRHRSVEECAVVARREPEGNKQLVAYVVTKTNGHSESSFELREYLRQQLPEFMIPGAIVVLDSLPLTPNGKVDRRELATREVHVRSERPYLPPRRATEELLCDIWQEVLHAERVGIDDNFFDLGGDSILTIQVIVKARALGMNLNVQQLFQYQTVQELAEELERSPESAAPVVETEPFSLISEADRLRMPAGVVDAYPLTALQAGMLFHGELIPEAGHYHDIFTFHLRLPFESEALRASLQQLLNQHPVLRTSFNLSDFSEPLQLVHEKVVVPLQFGDLRALSHAEQEEYLEAWLEEEKQRRFDWAQAPLLRFQIEQRDAESFQFSFSFHHAILDGWSVATMLTELFDLYSAVLETGAGASVAGVRAMFRDYVGAERAVLNSEAARQYWLTLLREAPYSRLPRLGPSAGPSRMAVEPVELSAELSLALKELASRAGVPLKSVLLAAHLRALNVLSGSDEVVTGIVSHGRPETTDGERVLGLFLNTLPFRQRLRGGTWLELVQETFAAEREALPYRRYPMAQMQQDLGNEAPLFEVIFNFVHFHIYEELQQVSGLEVLGSGGVAETNYPFGVDFSLELAGAQLRLELHYDAAEFSAEQMAAVGRNYHTILESMTHRPLERYEQQCLLSPEERQTILYQWNEPALSGLAGECYQQLFEMQVARTPNALAAALGAEQLTYDELNRRANQLAHYLKALGVGPEVPVAVFLERSLETLVVLLAIFKAGGAYVPLDPEYPDERLRFMMRDAGPELVVTQEKLSSRLADQVVKSIRMDADWPEIANESQENPPLLASASTLAYIIYTSGSSGTPKGVMITQGGMINCLQGAQQRYGLTAQDSFLMHISLSFDASVWEVFLPLIVGGRVVIAPAEGMLENRALLRYIAEQSVTCASFVPSLLGVLVKDPLLSEMSSLRYVLTGAEKLPLEVMREFQRVSGAELHNVYGPTETTMAATEWTCDAGAERVMIGTPIGNTQVYVLDRQMEPLPVGVAGELYIGGAGVGRGYAGQAALTAERFVPDRFSGKAGARLYRTGDLVRYDQQGVLEFMGRVDEQVKLRGYRIELGEIEAVLRQHPQVQAAVVVLREGDGDQRLVAYVVSDAQTSELREYLKEQLPDYMVPSFFVALNELPLLPNGKLDRRALPAPESVFAAAAEYEAPRTATEELLCGFWASVLQVNRVGINDNFFDLGGHSLLAIQLISRIRDAFGVELPLRELFETRTLAELAQSVDDQVRASHELVLPPLRPAARDDVLPLSFAQQRLWFLDQLAPENTAYTAAEALRLRGALNLAALEQSINELKRRHEGLRTTFPDVDGNPIQVITPFRHLALPLIDLSLLPDEDREAQVVRIASAEAQRPFNLQSGPLMRATLLRLRAEDHVLVLSMHHIISDEWSTAILAREVRALYDAFTTGNASPLTDLTIQYGDFAVWQREWLSGDVLARQLDYWTSKLQGVPALFALPTDYARPKVQLTEGAFSTHLLSPELTSDLKLLAQQSKATLYMTVLAAFHALLHRYAQQSTVVTGTVVANRTRVETEPLIGFFVNTLAVRSDFDDDPTFLAHLSLVREHALEAYAHQDLPFEMLVDELRLARDLSYHPLFQVMFSWEEAGLDDQLALKGLELSTVAVENHTSQFDLTLRVGEVNGQLRCGMQYNTALFEASTIRRMLTQFERLLVSAVREPEQHISQLELLSSAERHELLVARNDTYIPYPESRCIHELFEEQVAHTPEAPALTYQGEHLSYAELNARANQLAHYLRQLGVKAETPVGICLNRSLEMVVAVFAVLKAGGIYIPLDPQYPAERLFSILEEAQPSIILTTTALFDELPSTGAQGVCVDTDQEWWSALADTNLTAEVCSENLAHVLYTSGSTGQPKGVAVPHRGVVRLVKQETYVSYGPDEVFLQMGSLSFDASTLEIFSALLTGGRLVLLPPGAPSLDELAAVLTSEGVSKLWITAGLFHPMVEHEVNALAGVRDVMSGGDVLSVEHVRRLLRAKAGNGSVINGYGPTESTVFTCCHRISGEEELARGVPIGKPIGNTQVYVLGEKLELLGDGMVGELYIGGAGLARCYYNLPELTAERFVPHPFSSAGGERLYRTGDYVRWRADGLMEFVGRVDTQVKIRGYRIEPGEVEAVLGRHAWVSDCAVVARQQDGGEKYLVAYVVTKANSHSESSFELREYLRQQLPEFMIPAAIVALESLPLTPNGKVDRRELAAREVRVGSERPYAPPRTTTEELLCAIWQEVLPAERIGIDDNFFDLGGDSILTIRVIVKARAAGLELNVQQLFEYQTVHELAQELERSQESVAPVVETEPFSLISEADRLRMPAGVVDAYPLTALQAGMLFHSELIPEAGHYHDILTFHLRMPFEAEAMRATLQQLLEQHPVLRTSFNLSDFSEPLQLVHHEVAVPLQFGDLRGQSPGAQEEYLREWIASEKQRRFDWAQAPLLRFQIEQRDAESFQFSFSFHHAILDGWSVATMLTELFGLYSAVLETGAGASVAGVRAMFRDYVGAERAVLNSEAARQFWMTMLSEATYSRLPRLGQSTGRSGVASHIVEISAELSLALKELASTAGVPLKSVLLAAHLRALNVLTGSHEVVTGIVSHGRPETADGERVLGLFLNTLPFRQKLSGGTWLELVQETFAGERELLPFRRYPMARMQQDLGNDTPLEVTFNFMHFHVYEELQQVSGLEVLDSDGVADTNYTLAVHFSLELEGSQIKLGLQYDAAELSEAQIEAVGRNYRTILESMTRQPHERYQQQCLLSPQEWQTILHDWNDSATPELHSECYLNLFEAQVARTPNALAAVLGAEQLTYDELNRRANQLAHYLQAVGVGPEVSVGVLLERSLETIVALLAIFKAGGAYVPLDPEYPDERLRFMVRDADLELLITKEKLSNRLADRVVKSIRIDADWPEIANESQDNPALLASSSTLAYIIYTSGSSGTPKGVMITYGAMVNCLQWIQQRYDLTEQDAYLMHISLSFDPSVWEVLWPLMVGARVVIAPAEGMLESCALLSYAAEQSVTCAIFVPSLLGVLVKDPRLSEMSSLRYVISGGEKLPLEVMREFQRLSRAELRHVYGPTETTIAATEWACDAGAERVLMGRPIGNTQVYVLDGQMEPVPVGVAGELYIGGAAVGRGYAGQAALTAERFVPDRFSGKAGARLYRTGDLVRYDQQGVLEFMGRVDEQVKLRGFRIELGEIEAVLRGHQQVRGAVVVLREEEGDKWLVAYVVSDAQTSELREYLQEQLPEYMVPSFFVALDELPLLPNGKINRRALPALETVSAAAAEYEAPRTPTEELLCGLWASVLRVNPVGINDNFFELGGHSLLAIQLISRIRDAFSVELPLRELFERRTVAELAQSIDEQMRASYQLVVPPLRPAIRDDVLPLSFAQQRLWFLDQLAPGSVAYNLPSAVRLKGRLDVEALRRTLDEVVRRHEVLRTTFVAVNGEPVQVIAPPSRLELPVMDLSKLPEEEREAEARQLVTAEAQRPFDLSVGPLLRVQLLRFGAEDQLVLFTMHHIITDGWSTGILVSELAALYEAYVEGRESPLPELEIQYADYAVWQREWLQGEVLEQQLSYWRQQLEELPVLQLPTEKPRPPVQSYRGRSFNFSVPAPLTAELKKLSNAEGVTLYMTLLATFKILLWRYSGQSDVVVGTPIAGRNHLATEGLIGLFVNTLVLRTSLSGDPSFRELLDRIREVTLGAYAHDNLPFEKLVEELQPERDMSRSPLFQVMFSLQNATAETLRLAGLEAIDTGVGDETAKFDLAFGLAETEGELLGSLQYNVDLFDAATMERLVQHYELLLDGVVADPDRQLSQLPLLLEEDRHKLLVEWNDTHVAYDLEQCIHQLFKAQVSRTPDAIGVVDADSRLSYGELELRAEKLARRLRHEGVGPEQRVGILAGRGAAMVIAVLGVLKAGGAYVPLDAAYPLERLSLMVDDAQLSVLVAEEGQETDFVRSDLKVVRLNGATGECIEDAQWESREEWQAPIVTPENLAYVIYTSGSTGRPKGVAITHRSAVAFINWARDVFAPSALAGVLASTSLSFDLSVFELFVTLSAGGKIILADNALHLPALDAADEVTLINTVPSAMAELLRIGAAPARVQTINLAGEALPASLVQQIYQQTGVQQVWNLYGPSEDTTYSTSVLIEKNQSGPIVIGRPIANTQVYICDEVLQPVPVGVAGQLLLAGDGLARGYIGRPDLTAERFLPNPFSPEGGARLYVTGDLARYRADGQIEFLGRADSQLKLRGFRIEPGEIETRLREHPSVREAIVIATTEVDPDDKRLVAYVVTAHSGASVNDLRDYLRGTLPEYMVPSAFVLMNAFPLTPNGKIDRRALPLPDRATKSDSELTAPRDLLELQLIEIWKDVLRREQVGLRDNFFELGGHSLLAMRLVDKVERLVEQKLPLSILFQGATVEQVAATLRQRGGKVREQLLVSIQPEGSRPPLFLVHSASGNVMSYVTLARRLGKEQPVYGLQSKGLDPDRKPTARVEDMASEYLEELLAVQPEGPYFLGGWSMGGVIAFEMARQLTAQGKSVAPLVLIDSTIQTGRVKKNGWDDVSLLLALAEHHGLFLDDADDTFNNLRSLSLDEQLEFLLEKGAGYDQFPRDIGIPQLRHLFELFKVNVHATEHYRPAKSEQQVILLQAADAPPRHAATTLKRWKKVAEVVEAHRLPGDHYSIVNEPHVAVLAEQIKSVLTA